jgi:hypothetical protein
MTIPTIPSVGTDWKTGQFDLIDNRFFSRGGLCAVLIRDNRGLSTVIAPYQAGSPPTPYFSPFSLDGNLRKDLFAMVRVGGVWAMNQSANNGWFLIGAMDEKGGPERKAGLKHDDAMVLQSNFPFDSDIVGESMTIAFTGVQVNQPLMRRLRMNLPITDTSGNNLVEIPGNNQYVLSKPQDADDVDRQLLMMFARKINGQYLYTVEGYPLVRNTDVGTYKRDKTSSESPSLTFTVLPDPYHVDIDPTQLPGNSLIPVMWSEWVSGPAWAALSGAPVFPGLTPFWTATSTTAGNLQFQAAVGGGASVTYTVQVALSPYSSFTAATIGSTTLNDPTTGDVTIAITGLTASTLYEAKIIATGANTLVGTSAIVGPFTS